MNILPKCQYCNTWLSVTLNHYYRNPLGVPVFEKPPAKYSAMRIMQILLNPSIDRNKIAQTRPMEVASTSTFVVDLTKLAHPDDIKRDAYGRWTHKGSHADVFKCF